MFYVYEHWTADDSRLFYVGKGSLRRAMNKVPRNPYHKNIVSRYGSKVRLVGEFEDESESYRIEKNLIRRRRQEGHNLVNFLEGGSGAPGRRGPLHPLFGKPISDYHKKRISETHRGRVHSEDHRRRVGLTKIGNKYFHGHHHTEESKKKISNSLKCRGLGRKLSDETRRKMSIAQKGRSLTEDHKLKIKKSWDRRRLQKILDKEKFNIPATFQIHVAEGAGVEVGSLITINGGSL